MLKTQTMEGDPKFFIYKRGKQRIGSRRKEGKEKRKRKMGLERDY